MNNKLDNERTMTNSVLFKKLYLYLKPELGKFILAIFMLMVTVGCSLAIPTLYGYTIEEMCKSTVDFNRILSITLVFVCILVFTFIAEYLQALLLQYTGQSIIYRVRMDVFKHIEYTSIEQINQIPIGKLVTRVTNDTNALNELFTDVLINLLRSLVTLVGVIIFMFINNVKLATYMVVLMPFILVMTFAFNFWSRRAYRSVRKNLSEINASLSENLSGMKITQVFNAENKQYNEFKQRNERLRKSNLKQILLFAIFRPTIYVCYLGTVVIVFWFGGKEALATSNLAAISALVVFEMYIDSFFNPIQQLSEQLNVLQSSLASSERIFEILDTESNIQDFDDSIELEELKGEIEFKNVWFAYKEGEWVLRDISFKINAGETVAFVLDEYNINTLHINKSFSSSANSSRAEYEKELTKILNEYPSIKYVIDISRDMEINKDMSMPKHIFESTLGGCAQIRLVTGSDFLQKNEYVNDNISFMASLQSSIEDRNPELIRSGSISPFPLSGNLAKNSIRVYIGSYANSFPEANNAAILLAECFAKFLNNSVE